MKFNTYIYITVYSIILCLKIISGQFNELQKKEFCQNLRCDETEDKKVCGIRKQNKLNEYKLFENDCLLLKYGCKVDKEEAYGITNMKYCVENTHKEAIKNCSTNCVSDNNEPVCAIREDGGGFRVKLFGNYCELTKYNCEKQLQFNVTNLFICDASTNQQAGIDRRSEDSNNETDLVKEAVGDVDTYESFSRTNDEEPKTINQNIEKPSSVLISMKETTAVDIASIIITNSTETAQNIRHLNIITAKNNNTTEEMKLPAHYATYIPLIKNKNIHKSLVIVSGSMSEMMNVNRSADNFFAGTHVFDLPISDVYPNITERTRRMLIKIFGPVKVFKPWVRIPKEPEEDHFHTPTLSSCYHKCPTKCPDTYAPVCGMPGIVAREPSLMFQNHCFMDVAQCKMFWENKSWTAESSAYIEASFVFCLGNELNTMYRFLPLVRTLQHMGRLKKKGSYKYKLRNMKFFNNYLSGEPKFMG